MSAASRAYLEYVSERAAEIEAGNEDAMGIYFELGELVSELEKAKEQILPYACAEADRYEKKELDNMNINYQPDGRPMHDYKGIAEWEKAKENLKAIEEWAKANKLTTLKYSKPILGKKPIIKQKNQ